MHHKTPFSTILAAAALAVAAPAPAQPAAPRAPKAADARLDPPPGEYVVVDGRVDRGTYAGWRLFHSACHGCHGVDATGTAVAPDLTQRVKTMTPRAFVTKVLTSYRIVVPADGGTEDREAMIDDILSARRDSRYRVVMPAWEKSTQVSPHVLDLFAYLSARAAGDLGPGRPKPIVPAPRSRGR
jgi:mono/diheme cytochrome c family protein